MIRSYIVTGGGRGVGRAIVERLVRDGHAVVTIDRDPSDLDHAVVGDAGMSPWPSRRPTWPSRWGGCRAG